MKSVLVFAICCLMMISAASRAYAQEISFTMDFESGDLLGWTATGDAFEFQPTMGDNPTARLRGQPSKHRGQYWIGSFEKYQGLAGEKSGTIQGDELTGTLTSAPFHIQNPWISFLIGGGLSKQTRVELLIDGHPVLAASGKNIETMHKQAWNLESYIGQTAQIRIVDESQEGWGHINVDDFRFSDVIPITVDLTGSWECKDGGTYFVNQIGNKVWWYGRSNDGGATWSNVFNGTLDGSTVVGQWADIPQGSILSSGIMILRIDSDKSFTATQKTGGFGGTQWTRTIVDSRERGSGSTLQAWEGVEAPNFTVTSLDGEILTLSELKGKRVVVDIWATWCQPCVKEIPHFNQLRQEVSTDELIIVGVSKEAPSVIQPFIEEHGVNYPSVSTNALPSPYSDVKGIPTTFFIDRNGVIQTILIGYRDYDVLKKHALASDYEGEVRSKPSALSRRVKDDEQPLKTVAGETLTWEARVIQESRSEVVEGGVKTYSPDTDIIVQERSKQNGNGVWWRKILQLDDTFTLSAAIHRNPTLTGFGLLLGMNSNPMGFSWEWFDLDKGAVFRKRQGSGHVSVTLKKGPGYEELMSVEFLDDILLRYQEDMSKPPGSHSHEVIVRKGSVFRFAP